MKNNTLRAIIELNLEVLLKDFANNRMCHEANICIFWLSNDWMFRLYQRAFGRKDDSGPGWINNENLPEKIRTTPSVNER